MINLIFVNDWRDRYKGIIMLFEMAESNIDVVNMNVVKVYQIQNVLFLFIYIEQFYIEFNLKVYLSLKY